MQKKIASILFSTRLTAVLFLVFAVAMGIGTFLDASSDTSPTPYSRELIYNAWWFEAIMLFFVINFAGNIFRFRLHRKEKWATLLLHISFLLVLIGAFVTRYIGYEGVMHIREGETENVILSDQTYLDIFIDGDYLVDGVAQRRKLKPKHLRLSERLNNDFEIKTDYNGQPVTIKYIDFIKNAKEGLVRDESGEEYLKIVEAGDGNRHDHWIKKGELVSIHNVLFAVNKDTPGAINITHNNDGSYSLKTPFGGSFMRMADQMQGEVLQDSVQPLMLRSLYQMAGMSFVIPDPITKGFYGTIKAESTEQTNKDALILEITSKEETNTIELLGGKGTTPDPQSIDIAGLKVYMSYGSKTYDLPFSITLNDFIADTYPGTENAYSAFKSKITVNDSDTSFFDEEIYMNHVLDHKGYRFFQASFHDYEDCTILSVNHDFWGTWITYIGYFLLYFGLMAILFDPKTRFADLKRALEKIKAKKKPKVEKSKLAMIIFFLVGFGSIAQNSTDHTTHTPIRSQNADSIIVANAVSKAHAAKFAELVIQDNGRMKPINTFASELLRKISRKDNYNGMDANQVFISMTEFPQQWVEIPLISLKRGNDSIRDVAGVPKETKKISLLDLFDEKGSYKLAPYLQEATRKTNLNQFEKDFIKAHENYYLLNEALGGGILKIFPIPGDDNNKWLSYPELRDGIFKGTDSVVVKTILPVYFQTLKEARKTGDYSTPNDILDGIKKFQTKYGEEVMPSEEKIKAEIIYNKVDIFNRLYRYTAVVGLLMFLFIIMQIFKERKITAVLIKFCKVMVWVIFILMTLGLAARWYISGHAPWSDAYESIIYVAWATVFFGVAFGRKSNLTVAATAFVAAIILWVASENWLDPAIANLQPVLDSYWLMIHVAVIVGSYGPFTLGLILGTTSLILMLLTNDKNRQKMDLNIKEVTVITEMALTVGLVMLTIGNFLGGQWANESWGRYWGWDPKETWALISIMIYAFVIHARLVPGLRGRWLFNVMAIFAYASIMMTYFGVNFYLTGLHSYASGDVPVTPTFVYYLIGFFILLSTLAYFKYKKYYTKKG